MRTNWGLGRSMKVAVITSIMGGYDSVPPVPRGFTEAVLVSDLPVESDWLNVVMKTTLSPRLAAKIPKFRPDLFTTLGSSVWMDASMSEDRGWLKPTVEKALGNSDFCLFKHPDRDSVSQEVMVSQAMRKYESFPLRAQLEHYSDNGFPDNVGLFACGVIARNHTQKNQDFGNAWLAENVLWSIQDQVSFPYLAWKLGLQCSVFKEDLWNGPLAWKNHLVSE
jgi:hypothetical protein